MEAIAAGDYAHRVGESATEELGELVRSFNHMAADLEDSRRAVETSNLQLSAANAALEARRGELETMLETIPNGVATLDPRGCIVLANRALTEMLDPGGQTPFIGTSIEKIFPAEALESDRPPPPPQPSHGLRLRRNGDDHPRPAAPCTSSPPSPCSKPASAQALPASTAATSSSSKTPPNSSARKSNPPGKKSPAA